MRSFQETKANEFPIGCTLQVWTAVCGNTVPTALVALTVQDAETICDKLNRRLGLDREAWTAIAAESMRAEEDDPDGGAWH